MLTLTCDARDPSALAAFWAGLLRREVMAEAGRTVVPGDDTQLALAFVHSPTPKVGLNRMHIHLTSGTPADQEYTVATALSLGGSHLDVGQRPEEGHIVLADPEGNEFCVIEPGNSFLAGCGFLGELACDGTRAVGHFWSAALRWPLVWDQDEETAIQSPAGGTKVAWGGPPVRPRTGPDRQRFDLTVAAGDWEAEADRLVTLGATRLRPEPGGALLLTDPDGTEFRLTRRDE